VGSISQPSVIMGARAEACPSSTPQSSNPQSTALPGVANPGAALEAITTFFEDRQVMGRDEFLRILRKSKM
jgi:hypothetical protein